MPLSLVRLDQLHAAFAQQRILVVGDLMPDEFICGRVTRISPEAPVPVVQVQRSSFYPGGAANVVRNICSVSGSAAAAGVVGDDEPGAKLVDLLAQGGTEVKGILRSAERQTTQKTRVIARQQQVVRVDRESGHALSAKEKQWLRNWLEAEAGRYDAVIIEDYGKGILDQELFNLCVKQAKAHKRVIAVDPNPGNPLNWKGATAVKPNRHEAFLAAGVPFEDGLEAARRVGEKLQKLWEPQHLLLTMGEEGLFLFELGKEPLHIPARAREVFDVSGAGDTVIALFTMALAAGATGREAAELANCAAGIVVGKLGTATTSIAELREVL